MLNQRKFRNNRRMNILFSIYLLYMQVCFVCLTFSIIISWLTYNTVIVIIIRVFCSRAGPSLQAQEPRLQFCPKAGLPSQTQEPRLQFYQGLNRCGSFPLLSAPNSLFSIWTRLKRSEKIPVVPTWRWGGCIWLTGPSGLRRNSQQGLNISSIRVFDQIRDPEIPVTLIWKFGS